MSDTDKKLESEPKELEGNVESAPQNKSSSSAGLFLFTFLVVIALAGGLYKLWELQQQNTIKANFAQQKIQQLSTHITTLKSQQIDVKAQSKAQYESLTQFQENLRKNITSLVRDDQHFRDNWLMAEAEYLVQLANYRLLLEKDVTTAIVALKAADARLAEVADPALLKVREIVSNDLVALNNIAKIDLAGLSVSLSALSNNIKNLPLLTPDPKTHEIIKEEQPTASTEVNTINELPAAIWKDIKSLIVIRNHQQPVKPLLAPEQYFFLTQNLTLLLEQVRLALLTSQNEIYQERLQVTKEWISQYFDIEHNVSRNVLASIEALQKIDINPTLPDISTAYFAIKKHRLKGKASQEVKAKQK